MDRWTLEMVSTHGGGHIFVTYCRAHSSMDADCRCPWCEIFEGNFVSRFL